MLKSTTETHRGAWPVAEATASKSARTPRIIATVNTVFPQVFVLPNRYKTYTL